MLGLTDETEAVICISPAVRHPHIVTWCVDVLAAGWFFSRHVHNEACSVLTIYCHQTDTVLLSSGKLDFLRTLKQTQTDFQTHLFHIALEIFSSISYIF